jgi:hypothetical protein
MNAAALKTLTSLSFPTYGSGCSEPMWHTCGRQYGS